MGCVESKDTDSPSRKKQYVSRSSSGDGSQSVVSGPTATDDSSGDALVDPPPERYEMVDGRLYRIGRSYTDFGYKPPTTEAPLLLEQQNGDPELRSVASESSSTGDPGFARQTTAPPLVNSLSTDNLLDSSNESDPVKKRSIVLCCPNHCEGVEMYVEPSHSTAASPRLDDPAVPDASYCSADPRIAVPSDRPLLELSDTTGGTEGQVDSKHSGNEGDGSYYSSNGTKHHIPVSVQEKEEGGEEEDGGDEDVNNGHTGLTLAAPLLLPLPPDPASQSSGIHPVPLPSSALPNDTTSSHDRSFEVSTGGSSFSTSVDIRRGMRPNHNFHFTSDHPGASSLAVSGIDEEEAGEDLIAVHHVSLPPGIPDHSGHSEDEDEADAQEYGSDTLRGGMTYRPLAGSSTILEAASQDRTLFAAQHPPPQQRAGISPCASVSSIRLQVGSALPTPSGSTTSLRVPTTAAAAAAVSSNSATFFNVSSTGSLGGTPQQSQHVRDCQTVVVQLAAQQRQQQRPTPTSEASSPRIYVPATGALSPSTFNPRTLGNHNSSGSKEQMEWNGSAGSRPPLPPSSLTQQQQQHGGTSSSSSSIGNNPQQRIGLLNTHRASIIQAITSETDHASTGSAFGKKGKGLSGEFSDDDDFEEECQRKAREHNGNHSLAADDDDRAQPQDTGLDGVPQNDTNTNRNTNIDNAVQVKVSRTDRAGNTPACSFMDMTTTSSSKGGGDKKKKNNGGVSPPQVKRKDTNSSVSISENESQSNRDNHGARFTVPSAVYSSCCPQCGANLIQRRDESPLSDEHHRVSPKGLVPPLSSVENGSRPQEREQQTENRTKEDDEDGGVKTFLSYIRGKKKQQRRFNSQERAAKHKLDESSLTSSSMSACHSPSKMASPENSADADQSVRGILVTKRNRTEVLALAEEMTRGGSELSESSPISRRRTPVSDDEEEQNDDSSQQRGGMQKQQPYHTVSFAPVAGLSVDDVATVTPTFLLKYRVAVGARILDNVKTVLQQQKESRKGEEDSSASSSNNNTTTLDADRLKDVQSQQEPSSLTTNEEKTKLITERLFVSVHDEKDNREGVLSDAEADLENAFSHSLCDESGSGMVSAGPNTETMLLSPKSQGVLRDLSTSTQVLGGVGQSQHSEVSLSPSPSSCLSSDSAANRNCVGQEQEESSDSMRVKKGRSTKTMPVAATVDAALSLATNIGSPFATVAVKDGSPTVIPPSASNNTERGTSLADKSYETLTEPSSFAATDSTGSRIVLPVPMITPELPFSLQVLRKGKARYC